MHLPAFNMASCTRKGDLNLWVHLKKRICNRKAVKKLSNFFSACEHHVWREH